MNPSIKKAIAIAISLFIVSVLYYGSFLPLQKSYAYIHALEAIGGAKTLKDFTDAISVPLNIPSPIGQEELVRNVGGSILSLIKANGENAALTDAGVQFLMGYYEPVLARRKGMSFEQDLFVVGTMNEIAYIKTKDEKYLGEAQRYFEEGRELGPERPQFLYSLFDVYRLKNDIPHAVEVAQKILTLWPDDERLKGMLVPATEKKN